MFIDHVQCTVLYGSTALRGGGGMGKTLLIYQDWPRSYGPIVKFWWVENSIVVLLYELTSDLCGAVSLVM